MASLLLSLSSIVFIIFSLQFMFIPPTFSTSRRLINNHVINDHETGFRVSLKHVDSGKNLTKFERLQRGVMRGNLRLQRLINNMMMTTTSTDHSSSQVISPVHAGNGEFLMNLAIGTPPSTYSAIMDTGSDLIWTQCKPCTKCFDAPTPIFDPKKSSTFTKALCTDNLCLELPNSDCGTDGCEYLYSYGDYSSTQGVLATETFTFNNVSIKEVGFGCGEDNEGDGFNQGGGLVGLRRGPLSLVSQLKTSVFSYCLTSINDDTSENSESSLILGSLLPQLSNKTKVFTTPLIKNPSNPSFYYISLVGITVGNVDLPIKNSTFAIGLDGSGGMIIDSGTTITILEESAFRMVKKEFVAQTKLNVDNSGSTGLDLCFELPADDGSGQISIEIPKLVFHFDGASLDLDGENYMIGDAKSGLVCLAMGGSNAGISIFGNVQQQNMMVVHDLEKETLSFIPTQCDKL
ncbi:aspartic proteinase nepenthesin-1-like [Rutidosis leptorrhynchoides]|uniref:aspartic proteinase nepenthesin-1-like n=1 Tax=Rutidosis leptorrhynchoides TaxID=125765 RepID=UPI003A997CBF